MTSPTVVVVAGVCPVDGGRLVDEGLEYLVCQSCREMVGYSEVVGRATRRTKRRYLSHNHPGVPRRELRAMGY